MLLITENQMNRVINRVIHSIPKGASVNVYGNPPKGGYMVGLGGLYPELRLNPRTGGNGFAIWDWLEPYKGEFSQRPDLYVGGWLWIPDDAPKLDCKDWLHPEAVYVIDISRNVLDLSTALKLARHHGQIAIYDVAGGVCINV